MIKALLTTLFLGPLVACTKSFQEQNGYFTPRYRSHHRSRKIRGYMA